MALLGRQVQQLRSMAHSLTPAITIGKFGLTQSVVDQANAYLERHELMKVSVSDNADLDVDEAAYALAELLYAEVVQVIGHRFVLYRETSRDDVQKIRLTN